MSVKSRFYIRNVHSIQKNVSLLCKIWILHNKMLFPDRMDISYINVCSLKKKEKKKHFVSLLKL